jgi:hypothetical protein
MLNKQIKSKFVNNASQPGVFKKWVKQLLE